MDKPKTSKRTPARAKTPDQFPPEYRDLFLKLSDMSTEVARREFPCATPAIAFTTRGRMYSYLKALRESPRQEDREIARLVGSVYSFRVDGASLILWPKSDNPDSQVVSGMLACLDAEQTQEGGELAPGGPAGPDPYRLTPDAPRLTPEAQDTPSALPPSPYKDPAPAAPFTGPLDPALWSSNQWIAHYRSLASLVGESQASVTLRVDLLAAGWDPSAIPSTVETIARLAAGPTNGH